MNRGNGHDIAIRVFSFLPALEARGVDVASVLAKVGLSKADLEARHGYLDWPHYQRLAQALYEALPDDAYWIDLGGSALEMPALRVFGLLASTFTDEVKAYGWWARGFGSGSAFVPYLEYAMSRTGRDTLSISVTAPPGAEIPWIFRLAMLGAIQRLPTLLGRPAPTVHMEHEEGAVVFRLRLAPPSPLSRRLMTQVRAAVARFATEEARHAYEALTEQNHLLAERMAELELAEQERSELVMRLERAQRMEALGRLAGGIAHDFNNILTVVGGRGELLVHHGDPDVREHGEQLQRAAEQGARLVAQLLSFSRQQPVDREVVQVSELVATMEPMLRTLVSERHRFEVTLAESDTSVRFNRGHLEQVVMNLVANARDAIEASGTVRVVVRACTLSADEASRYPEARARMGVEIVVSDDGSGMDEETKDRAFEPFFTTKSGRGGGTGLGLATVYGLLRQAGGFVEIDSALGEGTTVRVFIPRSVEVAQESSLPSSAPVTPNERFARVLVVEDQPGVRRLMERVLSRAGHEVTVMATPSEALEAARERAFDLVVTDVVMPELTGPELVRALRAEHGTVPVLFVSGYAEEGVLDPEALPKRSAFLRKPFQLDDFHAAIQGLLADSRST